MQRSCGRVNEPEHTSLSQGGSLGQERLILVSLSCLGANTKVNMQGSWSSMFEEDWVSFSFLFPFLFLSLFLFLIYPQSCWQLWIKYIVEIERGQNCLPKSAKGPTWSVVLFVQRPQSSTPAESVAWLTELSAETTWTCNDFKNRAPLQGHGQCAAPRAAAG